MLDDISTSAPVPTMTPTAFAQPAPAQPSFKTHIHQNPNKRCRVSCFLRVSRSCVRRLASDISGATLRNLAHKATAQPCFKFHASVKVLCIRLQSPEISTVCSYLQFAVCSLQFRPGSDINRFTSWASTAFFGPPSGASPNRFPHFAAAWRCLRQVFCFAGLCEIFVGSSRATR
jgi:hypothetical protein